MVLLTFEMRFVFTFGVLANCDNDKLKICMMFAFIALVMHSPALLLFLELHYLVARENIQTKFLHRLIEIFPDLSACRVTIRWLAPGDI